MGRFIAAVLALVALLAGVVVLAPNLIPAKTYKGQLEAAATKALGRTVTMGDDLSFKIFPQAAFSVNDLVIANAEGFDGPHLARVERADIGVKLMPLLSKRVEITRFVLTRPDLALAAAKDGTVNWNLARPETSQNGAAPAEGAGVSQLQLGEIKLVDGAARFTDMKANKTYSLEAINATAHLQSLQEPLEIDGEMKFEGEPSTIKLVLTNLSEVIAKRPYNLKLDMKVGASAIGADLKIAGGEPFSYSGPITLSAPDLPALASLFDVKLEDAPGFDKLSVSGVALGEEKSLALSNAKIGFDDISADGDLTLNWAGAKPKATGTLATGSLDLRPYMPPPATSATGFPAWSEAKMDFTSLRNIDADLDISADKVFLNELEAGESRMNLKVAGGKMTAAIPQLGFYGGGGSGTLVVDATRASPSIAGKFQMASVEAEPFTLALMKMDKLLGIGGFNLEFSATGSSQAAIMRSLDGKGGFDLNDGAIKGVNIVKLASAVAKIYDGGAINPASITSAIAEAQRPDEKTDFSKFLSSFTIDNGVVNSPTISLEGPFLTMNGAGNVNLPGQTLDLRLLPTASTAMDNKSGRMVSIPVKVGGTFSKPTLAVDLETLVRGKAEQSLKGFLDKALKPKSSGDEAGAPSDGATDPASELLNGILGGRKPAAKPAPAEGAATEPASAPATKPATEPATKPATDPASEDPAAALINQGIGSLFGKKKPAADPAPAEDKGAN